MHYPSSFKSTGDAQNIRAQYSATNDPMQQSLSSHFNSASNTHHAQAHLPKNQQHFTTAASNRFDHNSSILDRSVQDRLYSSAQDSLRYGSSSNSFSNHNTIANASDGQLDLRKDQQYSDTATIRREGQQDTDIKSMVHKGFQDILSKHGFGGLFDEQPGIYTSPSTALPNEQQLPASTLSFKPLDLPNKLQDSSQTLGGTGIDNLKLLQAYQTGTYTASSLRSRQL